MTPRRPALAVLAGAALLLAACSSSPSPSSSSTTTTGAHHHLVTSTTTSTTAAAGSSTTSTSAVAAACTVRGASGQGQGAAGTITGTVILTNAGSTPCAVNGYPTIALYAGTGAPLTVTVVNGLTVQVNSGANAPPGPVVIPAGGTAQMAYQYSDVPSGSQTSCPQSEGATVSLPGGRGTTPSFPLQAGPCNNGTVYVSPVYASSG